MLKNLRYAFGHFAPLWPDKASQDYESRLRKLQSSFGYLNDVATASGLEKRRGDGSDAHLGAAIDHVLKFHAGRATHARERLVVQWNDLAKTKIARALASSH